MCWQVSFTIGGSNKSLHLFKEKKKKKDEEYPFYGFISSLTSSVFHNFNVKLGGYIYRLIGFLMPSSATAHYYYCLPFSSFHFLQFCRSRTLKIYRHFFLTLSLFYISARFSTYLSLFSPFGSLLLSLTYEIISHPQKYKIQELARFRLLALY